MNEKSSSAKSVFINTASEVAVVIIFDNEEVLGKIEFPGRPDLSKNLKPKVEELLTKTNTKKEEICEVRVFPGPGSFTGLRVGISFANALGFALGSPIYIADEKGNVTEKSKSIVFPEYGAEPRITKPKNS